MSFTFLNARRAFFSGVGLVLYVGVGLGCFRFGTPLLFAQKSGAASSLSAKDASQADAPGARFFSEAEDAEDAGGEKTDEVDDAKRVKIDGSKPLYLQDPFDIVRIVSDEGEFVIKTQPLKLPRRRVPRNKNNKDELELALFGSPDETYVVEWRYVQGWKDDQGKDLPAIEFFEDLVLDQAVELVRKKAYDDAYRYFEYLAGVEFAPAGFTKELSQFLQARSRDLVEKKLYEEAYLATLQLELIDPKLEGLQAEKGELLARLAQLRYDRGDYFNARRMLAKIPQGVENKSAAALVKKMREESAALVQQALAHAQADRPLDVARAAMLALKLWPNGEDVRSTAQEAYQRQPWLPVGVTSAGIGGPNNAWSQDRSAGLVSASPFLLRKQTTEGGEYESRWLELHWQGENRTRCSLRFAPSVPQGANTADLVDLFLQPQPGNPIVEIVSAQPRSLELLLRPHPIPQAAWTRTLPAEARLSQSVRLFDAVLAENGASYLSRAPRKGTTAPVCVFEQPFASRSAAFEALLRGDVAMVDRLHPLDVATASKRKDVVVGAYTLPRLHLLLPNPAKPLMRQRSFRRGIDYSIARKMLLEQELLSNRRESGWRLISGPFPSGVSLDDPVAYAYVNSLDPRDYDPRLSLTLLRLGLRQAGFVKDDPTAEKKGPAAKGSPSQPKAQAGAKESGKSGTDDAHKPSPASGDVESSSASAKLRSIALPPLTLVHPKDDMIETACIRMTQIWAGMGLEVKLRQLPDSGDPGDYDLLYADLGVWEPLVDADPLLRGRSPYVDLLLDRLKTADTWQAARSVLREIHERVFQEAAVIPLWQVYEHYAFDAKQKGMTTPRVTLYQDCETWQTSLTIPRE